jgi:hypothetical protein
MPRGKAKFSTMDVSFGSDSKSAMLIEPNVPDESPVVGTKSCEDTDMIFKELDNEMEIREFEGDIEEKNWKRNAANAALGAGGGAVMAGAFPGNKKKRDKDTLSAVGAGALTGAAVGALARRSWRTSSFERPGALLSGLAGGGAGLIASRMHTAAKEKKKSFEEPIIVKELSDDMVVKGITKRQVLNKVVDIADRAAPGALTFGTLGYLGLRQTKDKDVRIRIGSDPNPTPPAGRGRGKLKKIGGKIKDAVTPPAIHVNVQKVEKGVFQQVIAGAKSIGRDFNEINRATGRFAKQHKATAGTLAAVKVATWVPMLTAAANAAGIPIPPITMGMNEPMVAKELDESLVVKRMEYFTKYPKNEQNHPGSGMGRDAMLGRSGDTSRSPFAWSGTKEGRTSIEGRKERTSNRSKTRGRMDSSSSTNKKPFAKISDEVLFRKFERPSKSAEPVRRTLPPKRFTSEVSRIGKNVSTKHNLSTRGAILAAIPASILAAGIGYGIANNKKRD